MAINIFWFRRDLRLHDNTGLFHALKSGVAVLPVFIFDRAILDQLEDPHDRRVSFIYQALKELNRELHLHGSSLQVFYGFPFEVFRELIEQHSIDSVFTNEDYEPYAIQRDYEIEKLLSSKRIGFRAFKDQVIFAKNEVVKPDGAPYSVFTPYSKKWLSQCSEEPIRSFDTDPYVKHFMQMPPAELLPLQATGFQFETVDFSINDLENRIRNYHQTRDIPSLEGTSRVGVHLRFGTLSIRSLVRMAAKWNDTYLKELIWREFFMQMLWHEPRLTDQCYRPAYDAIPWRQDEGAFQLWCEGKTGYPLVDAGMRELNGTGFMHNRVRMVVASFLVKHLLIDWRWGAAYFASKLMDYELASNNGNWQWVAGCGCDAAPYFRIFNPQTQAKKFDPQSHYISRWVPEWDDPFHYPPPIIAHEAARERCLRIFRKALEESS